MELDPLDLNIKEEPVDDDYFKYLNEFPSSYTPTNVEVKQEPDINVKQEPGLDEDEQELTINDSASLPTTLGTSLTRFIIIDLSSQLKAYKCAKCKKEFAREQSFKIHQQYNMCANKNFLNGTANGTSIWPSLKANTSANITNNNTLNHKPLIRIKKVLKKKTKPKMVEEKTNKNSKQTVLVKPKCDKCQIMLDSYTALYNHVKTKHSVQCKETISIKLYQEQDLKKGTERLLICDQCGDIYSANSPAEKHLCERHRLKYPFKCSSCDAMFETPTSLRAHIARSGYHSYGQLNYKTGETIELSDQIKTGLEWETASERKNSSKNVVVLNQSLNKLSKIKSLSVTQTIVRRSISKRVDSITLKCKDCLEHFEHPEEYDEHQSQHYTGKSYNCHFCSENFYSVTGLSHHLTLYHTSIETDNANLEVITGL